MKTYERKMGNTDKMAWSLVGIMCFTILMSFILSIYSIHEQYLGALACWTACISPLDAVLGIVLRQVVCKNTQENTSADGEGIKYRMLVNQLQEGGEL